MNKNPAVPLKDADVGDFHRIRNCPPDGDNVPRPDGGKHTLPQNLQTEGAMRAQQLRRHILSEVIHRLRHSCHKRVSL
jgi:hypothetical protein